MQQESSLIESLPGNNILSLSDRLPGKPRIVYNQKLPGKPKDTLLPRVINFSGGQSSALMTILEYRPGDIVLFCDTGREHPKTYKFIHDFTAFENIPVTWLRYGNAEKPFDALLKKKHYKKIPNRMKRICTVELKVRLAKQYLRSIGIQHFENLVGFRADEKQRVINGKSMFKKVINRFPLDERGITKPYVNEYWKSKPYRLEIPPILGNCTLCFMKGTNAIIAILSVYPELAAPWIEDERKAKLAKPGNTKFGGYTYFKDVTIEQLLSIAQNNLFKEYDLSLLAPAYNCACTT